MDIVIVLVIILIMIRLIWCFRRKNPRRKCYWSMSITNCAKYQLQIRADNKNWNIEGKRKN